MPGPAAAHSATSSASPGREPVAPSDRPAYVRATAAGSAATAALFPAFA
jgi:hypothetical protein